MRYTSPAAAGIPDFLRMAGFGLVALTLLGSRQPPHGSSLAGESGHAPSHRSLYQTASLCGTLEVTEADRVRYLFVDGVLQTGMYADPDEVAKECHLFSKRYWLELLPYFRPQGKRCLLIGLGGGLLPAVLAGYEVKTHSVEIDAKVVEVAQQYFGYKQGVTVGDGREYLARLSDRHDFIVIDAFAGAKFPYSLASKECFRLVEKNLDPSGVLALNLISKPVDSRVSASVAKTLKTAFPHVLVYRTDPLDRVQSLVYFASKNPLNLTVHPHGRDSNVTAEQLATIREFEIAPSSPEAVVLTDGHNPLERQWSQETDQWRQRMLELFGRR
jgi:spermidine synthase